MSRLRMLKCTLAARRQDADSVLQALQDAGIVHVVPVVIPAELAEDVVPAKITRDVNDDATAIHGELERRRKALVNVSPATASMQVTDKSVPEVLELIDGLLHMREHASEEKNATEAKIAALDPWGDLDPDDMRALREKGLRLTLAILTRAEWHGMSKQDLAFAIAREEEERLYVVFFDLHPEDTRVSDVGAPDERLSTLQARLEELGREVGDINRELGRYAHYLPMIEGMMSALVDRADLLLAYDSGLASDALFALEGYIPAENVLDLEAALEPFEAALHLEEPALTPKVPVKLRNNWLVSGFEKIVGSFSGIGYHEKDFTWAVGILFVVFGSLCLLDAGYGVLLLITGVLLKVRGVEGLGKVFALTGAVSILMGALAGQFFGMVIGQHILLDMLPVVTLAADPYSCFLFSLVVGMFALVFSYALAIWQRGLKTHATGALLLVLAAIAAVFGNMAAEYVLTLLYSWHPPPAEALAAAGVWGNRVAMFLGIGAILSFFAFPEQVFGPTARVGNIIWTLYSGTTGFVQDVLSHMRLFGIALSGSIMALVVNEIGSQFPLPVTLLFAVVGHVFVYLLALLSLYIHTNRLIFLEFGSKCIDGGHNPYSPLRRRSPA
jgi:V/A-type H+/Na+-transporting ATPase subunit I